jgi:Fe-S cluster assembly scaffold protein SufB
VGEIEGDNNLDIEIKAENQEVFLTAKTQHKKPAFLNVFVKNTGKNSFFRGKILCQNYNSLKIDVFGHHFESDTGIIIKTKLAAHSKSDSVLTGTTKIEKNCINCESDIGFAALAAEDAKIQFIPKQFIHAKSALAEHSASIERFTDAQTEYLRTAGLSGAEIKQILEEAFLSE